MVKDPAGISTKVMSRELAMRFSNAETYKGNSEIRRHPAKTRVQTFSGYLNIVVMAALPPFIMKPAYMALPAPQDGGSTSRGVGSLFNGPVMYREERRDAIIPLDKER